MKTYDTEQRRTLLAVLEENPDRFFSAAELEKMCDKLNPSTVYRILGRLVDEGKAERSASSDGRQFVYRYTAASGCAEHLHLKCKKCGQIVHLEDREAEELLTALMKKCDFTIDEAQSLLVGVCSDCTK